VKVALVYDRVNKIGGAERVLTALGKIFPGAPLYTAVYNPETAPWAKSFKVIPSFLQRFPLAKTRHEYYPWLTPLAFGSFSFDAFDAVISITSAEAKGIFTKPQTFHLCYCLTPTRYLWNNLEDYKPPFFAKPLISWLRKWDRVASYCPDVYLAISKNVQKRIKKYYGQNSEVVYPPIDTEKFVPNFKQSTINHQPFFLVVSRLVAYKKIDLAIQAFNELGLPLKIVGTGVEEKKLKKMANDNISFLGQLTDQELLGYYQKCAALVFPQEEDFGLVPLEAQACGRPVIAYKAGGALETVVEGRTGEFFFPQTKEALIEKVADFKIERYKKEDCRRNAEKFGFKVFEREFKKQFDKAWKNHLKTTFI